MRTVVIVVTHHTKEDLITVEWGVNGVVGGLLETAQGRLPAILHDANPRAGYIDITQSSHIAIFQSLRVQFNSGDRGRADDALC